MALTIPDWYQARDRSRGTLDSAITAASLTANITLDPQAVINGGGFPDAPSILTFYEQNPATGEEIKVEQVEVSNIVPAGSSATATIVRAFSDTTAYDRPAGSTWRFAVDQEYIQQIQDEVDKIITDVETEYLLITEYINGDFVYAPSTTGTDDYAITLPVPITAYKNGQRFVFQIDTGNTGAASLNVDGLGAIDLKKYHDQDLVTGDLEAGQIVEAYYNDGFFEITGQLANPASGIEVESLASTFVLGEDFTNGGVDNEGLGFLGCGEAQIDNTGGLPDIIRVGFDASEQYGRARIVLPPVSKVATDIKIRVQSVGSPIDDLLVELFDVESGYTNTFTIPGGTIPGVQTVFTLALSDGRAGFTGDQAIIRVSRTGAFSATDYFQVNGVTAGSGLDQSLADTGYIFLLGNQNWELFKTINITSDYVGTITFDVENLGSNDSTKYRILRNGVQVANGLGSFGTGVVSVNAGELIMTNGDVITLYMAETGSGVSNTKVTNMIISGPNQNMYYESTRGFEQDKMRLSDNRSIETTRTDGIAQESGLAGESKKFFTSGFVPNTTNTVCDPLYLQTTGQYLPTIPTSPYSLQIGDQLTTDSINFRSGISENSAYETEKFSVEMQFTNAIQLQSVVFRHGLGRLPDSLQCFGYGLPCNDAFSNGRRFRNSVNTDQFVNRERQQHSSSCNTSTTRTFQYVKNRVFDIREEDTFGTDVVRGAKAVVTGFDEDTITLEFSPQSVSGSDLYAFSSFYFFMEVK